MFDALNATKDKLDSPDDNEVKAMFKGATEFVVKDLVPLSSVEKEGFIRILQTAFSVQHAHTVRGGGVLNANLCSPSKNTVRVRITKMG